MRVINGFRIFLTKDATQPDIYEKAGWTYEPEKWSGDKPYAPVYKHFFAVVSIVQKLKARENHNQVTEGFNEIRELETCIFHGTHAGDGVIYMKYSIPLLKQLCEIYGLNRNQLATKAGFKSLKSVYFYFDGKEPNHESRCKIGKVFGVYFVDDWDGHIDNEKSLSMLKKRISNQNCR